MKNNIWLRDENRGIELEGRTIGIIGFGHTGRAFAKKLRGFDMNILAYDKYISDVAQDGVVMCASLDRLYQEADIVSFHVPLQEDTKHYFNSEFVKNMQKPFILINTSRGPVVETAALYNGMLSGKLKGACLDVYETEPIANMMPRLKKMIDELLVMPNFVGTPHIAGYTHEALYKMSFTLLNKLSEG